jgi:uncharacterized ferredoxin-like protein
MIHNGEASALKQVAEAMALAARTAPKGKGQDTLEILILEKEDIQKLADEMERLSKLHELPGFVRDAGNIRGCAYVVLLGTKIKTLGLKWCGLCGFKDCAANQAANGICVYNTHDLGIAVGSAVSVAAAAHADNRIMYSIGMAVLELGWMKPEVKIILGIPLSGTGKNVFFDRK